MQKAIELENIKHKNDVCSIHFFVILIFLYEKVIKQTV